MTLPPFLTRTPARALMWFWAGIVGLGAAGATTLQVMGPPAAAPAASASPASNAPVAADQAAFTTPIAIPSAPGSLWPATNPALSGAAASAASSNAASSSAASSGSRPAEPTHHAAPPRQVRITVVPPMPPEPHRAHAPGPRLYARLELRAPHHNPTRERVVTYAYAEPQAEYPRAAPYGYESSYASSPGYGWQQYPGPRAYGPPRGQYYAYYPSY